MPNTFLKVFVVLVLSFIIAGCGYVERVTATASGWSRICVSGVSYIQFTSGASVEYTPEGTVKTCSD